MKKTPVSLWALIVAICSLVAPIAMSYFDGTHDKQEFDVSGRQLFVQADSTLAYATFLADDNIGWHDVNSYLNEAIELANKVDDDFLRSLHAEAPERYKADYIQGIEELIDSRLESDQKIQKWNRWADEEQIWLKLTAKE